MSAISRPNGSATPLSSSQASAERALSIVSLVVKVLDATTTRVACGSKPATASASAAPSTLADHRDLVAPRLAAERIDEQLRPQRRTADAEMEDMAHRPQRLGLDRVDQGAHPLVQRARPGDALRRALAALGRMLGGAAFGRVDLGAGIKRLAPRGEAGRLGEREERGQVGGRQMRLGEIEADARFLDHQPLQPVRLGREQLGERRRLHSLNGRPGPIECLVHAPRL